MGLGKEEKLVEKTSDRSGIVRELVVQVVLGEKQGDVLTWVGVLALNEEWGER